MPAERQGKDCHEQDAKWWQSRKEQARKQPSEREPTGTGTGNGEREGQRAVTPRRQPEELTKEKSHAIQRQTTS